MRIKIQVILSCIALLVLGYIYGSQATSRDEMPCDTSDVTTATLTKTIAFAPTQARYVFTSDAGCSYLVYASRFPALARGSVGEITGTQETPEDAFAGLPEYAEYLRDEKISLVVKNAQVNVIKSNAATLDTFRVRVASSIGTLFREPSSSLVTAMITGDQGGIIAEVKDVYRKSGITHILSISGLHVSIIAVVLTSSIGVLQVPRGVRTTIIFILLWVYIVGVGSPASAIRAGVFWSLYVLAYHARALVGTLSVVLLTLALLLTHSPSIVNTIGFQLSVTAVCGIGVALFFTKRMQIKPWIQAIVSLCAVSFGATLATAPLTLYYFGTVSFVGIIANMFVVPLLPVATYLVLVALFMQPFTLPIALMFSYVVHILFSWILFVARLCASIPYGNVENISFPLWGVFAYYGVLGTAIILTMMRYKISWRQWWV